MGAAEGKLIFSMKMGDKSKIASVSEKKIISSGVYGFITVYSFLRSTRTRFVEFEILPIDFSFIVLQWTCSHFFQFQLQKKFLRFQFVGIISELNGKVSNPK